MAKLNPFLLPTRAENMELAHLKKLRRDVPFPFNKQWLEILNFLDSDYFFRRSQIGLKGWGKTLAALIALNYKIEHDDSFIPLMLHFDLDKKAIAHIDPLKMASQEVWGTRLRNYPCLRTAFEAANCIVFDDIHYIFENAAVSKNILNNLLDLLRRALPRAGRRQKVLLISEEPLFTYSEILRNQELDDFLMKFGLVPNRYPSGNQTDLIDFGALHEVPYFNREEWKEYVNLYGGITFEPLAAETLFSITAAHPRALVAIAHLFGARHVTDRLLVDIAIRKLASTDINGKTLKIYEWLMRNALYLPRDGNQFILPSDESAQKLGICARNVYQMYSENGWLFKPFEEAYGSYLREEKSSQILRKRRSIQTGLNT